MAGTTIASTFVVVFRETLEAGLIVGIILTVLARLRAMRYAPQIWLGVAAAVVLSGVVAAMLSLSTAHAQDRWQAIIEGVISLAASGVLTWMVFWMHAQSRRIRPELEARVESVVGSQELRAMVLLPFLAVFREGAETVLFLKAVAIQGSGSVSLVGGLSGAAAAIAVTMAIFVGGRRVPLKALFASTGFLLLLMAAGLLAYGVHELEGLGWLPPIVKPIWDTNAILHENQGLGAFLKALLGYNGNPSLLEVIAYVTYLVGIGTMLQRVSAPKINTAAK